MESLTLGGEALRTNTTPIVDRAHGNVTGVARDLDGVIFHDVLLKDSLSADVQLCLIKSMPIEIGLREETIVAGDVLRHLCCAD